MIFPMKYLAQGLQILHEGQGYPGMEWTLALCSKCFYLSMLCKDIAYYVSSFPQYQLAKGHYTDPKTKLSSLIANNLLYLLCIDLMKMDPSKDGEEDVFILKDAFSKFTQAFVTSNQKSHTMGKE